MKMIKKTRFFLLLLVCSVLFCGCRATHYVPVYQTNTEYITQHDSIYVCDSIYEFITYRNDTVIKFKDRYHIIYEHKTDTIIRVDSIPVIVEVEKIIEINNMSNFNRIILDIGYAAIFFIIFFIFYFLKKFF